jgi:diguanylate cyclase (GGDEF)-like protein/PAS domain S-box-containing protein
MFNHTTKLSLVLFLGVVVPIIGGYVLSMMEVKHISIPLHSTFEASGGVLAIVFMIMISLAGESDSVLTKNHYASFALVSMAIYDIYHATVYPGEMFVWLHSLAVLVGGVFFTLVLLPEKLITHFQYRLLRRVVIGLAIAISTLSLLFTDIVPQMLSNGQFTDVAILMNIIGGIGFFIATLKYTKRYLRSHQFEDLIFVGLTSLFAMSGILFATSSLWDLSWWLWHLLRLIAYIVLLYYLIKLQNTIFTQVERSKQEAEINYYTLQENQILTDAIMKSSPHAIIATDIDGTITLFNEQAEKLLGYHSSDVVQKETPALFHKPSEVVERAEQFSKELEIDFSPGFEVFIAKSELGIENRDEWTYVTKYGKEVPVSLHITKLIKPNTFQTIGYLGMAEDITLRKLQEKKIKSYLDLIDQNIITSSTNLNGIITDVSKAFCEISGYSSEELIGQSHKVIRHPDMPVSVYEELWDTIKADKTWVGEVKNLKKDGSYYWVKATISPIYDIHGKKVGYTAIRQDITDKKRIEEISITDGLTNIYNRRHFDTLLPQIINSAKRNNQLVNFLIMDIDHFKQYNDTYGHQAGDEVLIKVASAIKSTLKRADDYCFRLGGEEFGILFNADSIASAKEYSEIVRHTIEELKLIHEKNSASQYVTGSFGLISMNANDVDDIELLYRNADQLLYQSKESGRNRVSFELKNNICSST